MKKNPFYGGNNEIKYSVSIPLEPYSFKEPHVFSGAAATANVEWFNYKIMSTTTTKEIWIFKVSFLVSFLRV